MSSHSCIEMTDGSFLLKDRPGGLWVAKGKKNSLAHQAAEDQNRFVEPWMAGSIARHGPEKPHG